MRNDDIGEDDEANVLTTHSGELQDFLQRVQQSARLANYEEAHRAAQATLTVLGQSISGGEARRLAEWLPAELREQCAEQSGHATAFDKANFVDKVGGMLYTVDAERGENEIRAVLRQVRASAPHGELDDTISQLPAELAEMFH